MRVAITMSAALLLLMGGCTTTPADGSPKIQTTSEANREDLESAVQAPLRDVNVLRTKIPAVLLEALADPYARPDKRLTCHTIEALLAPLDDALGPDLDQPPEPGDSMGEQGRDGALGMVAGAASDVIPFRSWVRKLTGAERHDRLVQKSILAGAVRRGYLKGLGESKGCNPPATPAHMAEPPPVVTQEFKPRYPIR
ncbi:hypothetical protein [Phenylobacterium sp.]|uniref:hypothetical protein n=1 Tax=Phenylobacterium sp. TaxID=1871053 RepID=UPI0035B04B76